MLSARSGSTVELTVPADQAMMLIIRLTTSGIAARSGMSMSNIDDFKIAVEEAASYLLYGEQTPEKVHVEYRLEEKAVSVVLEGIGISLDKPQRRDETEQEIIRAVLTTMVDEVKVTHGTPCRVELRKNCRCNG